MKIKFIKYRTIKDSYTQDKPVQFAVMKVINEPVYYRGIDFHQTHVYYTSHISDAMNANYFVEPFDKNNYNRKLDIKKYKKLTRHNKWEQLKGMLRNTGKHSKNK